MKPTPRPWRTNTCDGDSHYQIHITSGGDTFRERIGTIHGHAHTSNGRQVLRDEDKANANHIIKCVNLHDEMTNVLKHLSSYTKDYLAVDDECSAILADAELVLAKAMAGEG